MRHCAVRKPIPGLRSSQLLLDEADKRLESCTRRLASIEQRLGILVGSSAIAGSLATEAQHSDWTIGAIGAIAIGAILGVIGLVPRKYRDELPWKDTRDELWPLADPAVTMRLADRRIEIAGVRERAIKFKARVLTVGFAFLAGAVVLLFANALGVVVTLK